MPPCTIDGIPANSTETGSDGDGLGLILENAFDLRPSVPDASSPRAIMPGTNSLAVMDYSMPPTRLNDFSFVSEISDSLENWSDQVVHPDYFKMASSDLTGERPLHTRTWADLAGRHRRGIPTAQHREEMRLSL